MFVPADMLRLGQIATLVMLLFVSLSTSACLSRGAGRDRRIAITHRRSANRVGACNDIASAERTTTIRIFTTRRSRILSGNEWEHLRRRADGACVDRGGGETKRVKKKRPAVAGLSLWIGVGY